MRCGRPPPVRTAHMLLQRKAWLSLHEADKYRPASSWIDGCCQRVARLGSSLATKLIMSACRPSFGSFSLDELKPDVLALAVGCLRVASTAMLTSSRNYTVLMIAIAVGCLRVASTAMLTSSRNYTVLMIAIAVSGLHAKRRGLTT